eukprot:TRINITY_DN71192_c0_g1_i1.p1 TRINITY_DN71192_c0_g1~~TRINITY_DN71192_c0_g1_i1.p1  ORF type:complete len:274 (-),score=33.84 TRINITY_DN71192_c0_g1_i1:113-934(-)
MPLARLFGERLLASAGRYVQTKDALAGASAVGVYFSASWCPPCRGFTPQLIDSYTRALEVKNFRCVLVSWDRDEASFDQYFTSMPWFALPYADDKRREDLNQHFGVKSIPTLAVVSPDGTTITTEARNAVVRDPDGQDYPWKPPLVRDLAHGDVGRLNECPSVVYLCEHESPENQHVAFETLASVAQEALLAGNQGKTYEYFLGSGGPLCSRIREVCKLPDDGKRRLIMLDIPDQGGFYCGPEIGEALPIDAVKKFLADYESGSLERSQLLPP